MAGRLTGVTETSSRANEREKLEAEFNPNWSWVLVLVAVTMNFWLLQLVGGLDVL